MGERCAIAPEKLMSLKLFNDLSININLFTCIVLLCPKSEHNTEVSELLLAYS